MTAPGGSPAFLTMPWPDIDPDAITVSDRTSDLDSVIVYLSGGHTSVHLADADIAQKLADAFTKAASLLRSAGPNRFCPKCGREAPEHASDCPKAQPTFPQHEVDQGGAR